MILWDKVAKSSHHIIRVQCQISTNWSVAVLVTPRLYNVIYTVCRIIPKLARYEKKKSQRRVISRQIELSKAIRYYCWSSYGVGRLSICQCSGMVEAEDTNQIQRRLWHLCSTSRASQRTIEHIHGLRSICRQNCQWSSLVLCDIFFGIVLLQRYHYILKIFLLVRSY